MKQVLAQVLIATVACLVAVSLSFAADGKKGDRKKYDPAAMFDRLDTNKDGSLDKDEWLNNPRMKDASKERKEAAEKAFDKVATGGKVSKEKFPELLRASGGRRGEGRKKSDDNK